MPLLEQISTTEAPAPSASYSQAIAWDRLVATGGQVGADPRTGALPEAFEDEVRQALENLRAVLRAAGTSPERVLKTTCFLTDISTFPTFDRIYRDFFPDPLPARSTIGIALAGGLRFEIEAWAVRDPEGPA
ncbi:RidA family protein [Jiangella sp. DSM 45060]|uniref:RidA family protein n=1 Tax=Jiangella sp. DSM 45060 TaxID=1798224 RepID=UPI00087D4D6D|nr:Rid family detoxifying hydrolase [Jiangella sp. DSM 45060]SDS44757.1 endoribonuclease L-PSP [Jiangella sp. DSM 45060]